MILPPTHKLMTAALAALAALVLPLYLVPPELAIQTVKFAGYWLMLATCALLLWQLWRECRQVYTSQLRDLASRHVLGLLLAATLGGFLQQQGEAGFKILYDEHLLSSTAMNLHRQQMAYVQAAGHHIDGEAVASLGHVDKRPLLFPLLLSMVHNVFGFDYRHVFALNAALTFIALALLYALLARLTGRSYGWLGLLLFGGLPLLAQNATGGGYEMLNLCLILGLTLAALHYFQQEDGSRGLDLMLMTAILLANVRYESILYVLVPVAVFLLKSWRSGNMFLSWFSVCSPLLLIPPLLSLAIFRAEPIFFHTTPENFFGLTHLPGNLTQALRYLFDWRGAETNSLLLSIAGLAGLLLFLAHTTPRLLQLTRARDAAAPLFTVLIIILVNTVLALSSYWGAWTDPVTARFSLPLQLAMVLGTAMVLFRVFHRPAAPLALVFVAAAYLFFATPFQCERMRTDPRLAIARGYDWVLHWITHQAPPGNHLYLAQSASGIGLLPVGALPFRAANAAPEQILALQAPGGYDEIFLVQALVEYDAGQTAPLPGHLAPHPAFTLETCDQRYLTDDFLYRISRVTTPPPSPPLQHNRDPQPQTPHQPLGQALLQGQQSL